MKPNCPSSGDRLSTKGYDSPLLSLVVSLHPFEGTEQLPDNRQSDPSVRQSRSSSWFDSDGITREGPVPKAANSEYGSRDAN